MVPPLSFYSPPPGLKITAQSLIAKMSAVICFLLVKVLVFSRWTHHENNEARLSIRYTLIKLAIKPTRMRADFSLCSEIPI